MGLLDDAIREHLELKRRSGADPGAIAQAEHEALDPIFAEQAPLDDPHEPVASAEPQPQPVEPAEPQPQADVPVEPTAPARDVPADAGDAGFSSVGQETAELDMSTVLEAPPGTHEAYASRATSSADAAAEEGFEWEAPGERQEPMPEQIPGQERLTFE